MHVNSIEQLKDNITLLKSKNSEMILKKSWEVVREVLGTVKNKSNIPSYFSDNGSIIQGNYNIAQGFNKFFCEIGPKLAENIPISTKSYKDYLGNEMEENFVYKNITKDVILDKGCK